MDENRGSLPEGDELVVCSAEEGMVVTLLAQIRDELRRHRVSFGGLQPRLMKLADAALVLGVSKSQLEILYAEGKVTRYSSNGKPGGNRLVDPEEVVQALRVTQTEESESQLVDRLLAELTEER